ncbi:MAG: 1-acyl-sn-glycerol-3-phosphate acyltransferase [Flavobacteriia bacterium]|nr:1-acyl-sn-glycerol-3-phosphate acyltransferase [Flavobacteriia bacterium]
MKLNPFSQDIFGNNLLIKRVIIFLFGSITWYRFNIANKTVVEGTKNLADLPSNKVLFVSNHQTYFADVSAMYQTFNHVKWKKYDRIDSIWTLLSPKLNVYFIAAKETMSAGILPRLMAYAGSVSIKRSWREAGKNVDRGVDPNDIEKIRTAINSGWVITFPQGTTRPFVKGRRGTAHLIKEIEPIVIPVVVDGFRRAFDRKGLLMKKKGTTLNLRFKEPLDIDYTADAQSIMKQIMDAIEQSDEFNIVNQLSLVPEEI